MDIITQYTITPWHPGQGQAAHALAEHGEWDPLYFDLRTGIDETFVAADVDTTAHPIAVACGRPAIVQHHLGALGFRQVTIIDSTEIDDAAHLARA